MRRRLFQATAYLAIFSAGWFGNAIVRDKPWHWVLTAIVVLSYCGSAFLNLSMAAKKWKDWRKSHGATGDTDPNVLLAQMRLHAAEEFLAASHNRTVHHRHYQHTAVMMMGYLFTDD